MFRVVKKIGVTYLQNFLSRHKNRATHFQKIPESSKCRDSSPIIFRVVKKIGVSHLENFQSRPKNRLNSFSKFSEVVQRLALLGF